MTVGLWGCEAAMVVLVETRRWIYLMSYICTDRLNTSAPLCSPPLLVPCNKCCRNDLNMLLMTHFIFTTCDHAVPRHLAPAPATPQGKLRTFQSSNPQQKYEAAKYFFQLSSPKYFRTPSLTPRVMHSAACIL